MECLRVNFFNVPPLVSFEMKENSSHIKTIKIVDHPTFQEKIVPGSIAVFIKKWMKDNINKVLDSDEFSYYELNKTDLLKIHHGEYEVNLPIFSYFKAPVKNVSPFKEIDLFNIYKAISGHYYGKVTEQFRSMPSGIDKSKFKTTKFDHVTFAGTFTSRKSDALKDISGYACFDFDHVSEGDVLKQQLISDPSLDVQMLFVSPSGDGLKMILYNEDSADYPDFYSSVINYLHEHYPLFASTLDAKTKDIARTCFVCHDPNVYIKPDYLELCQK
jgi:hypothetical protein